MNVLAFQSEKSVIVSMSVEELLKLAGFSYSDGFNKLIGFKAAYYSDQLDMDKKIMNGLLACEIPVSSIYADAKETLEAYSDLKTKMESIKNQLTTLTAKMNREPKAVEKKGSVK